MGAMISELLSALGAHFYLIMIGCIELVVAVFLPIPFLCQFREPGCQIVFSCKKLSPSAYRAAIARYA